MIPIDLTGKTALITGASGQLGRVMARTLGAAGADVILHSNRNREAAEKFAAEIAATGVRALAVTADVTDQESVNAMQKELAAAGIRPDILVNSAVIQYGWTDVLSQDPADFESQFYSCVMQNVYMAKAFLPHMKEQGYGRFIAINTECAMQCFPRQAA